MKKLTLVRHAKSSWEFNISDHERPLNFRGFKDANAVSKELMGPFSPELIMSSDALRTRTTAEIFVSNLDFGRKPFILNHDLYDFAGDNLIKVVKNCTDNINQLLLFGHNNAITNFVNSYGNVFIDNVPTCGVVVMEFEIETWNALKKGRTIKTLFPRDLKG